MLQVEFEYVPKGLVFKEMVLQIQESLLYGGIHTNMFRPKRVVGKDKERPLQVYFYVDSIAYAK